MTTAITVTNTASVEVGNFRASLVEDWLNFNADKAAATVKTYSKAVGYFVKWLADNNIANPTRQDIINYRQHLVETKKIATARLYTVAVKTMFKWAASNGLCLMNVAEGVKTPSLDEEADTHSREALTLTEARKVLSSFNGRYDEKSLRDALIMRIMLNCGLRSIEVVRLDATDIEHRHGKHFLKVWGKGRKGKTARVEISKTIYNQLLDYLNARGSKREKGEPMFVSTARRNFGQRLQTQTISKLAKATFRSVGIDSEAISCHSCRHFTCNQLLIEGADIESCRRLLRHKNVSTTNIYRHDIQRATDNSVQILSDLLDVA